MSAAFSRARPAFAARLGARRAFARRLPRMTAAAVAASECARAFDARTFRQGADMPDSDSYPIRRTLDLFDFDHRGKRAGLDR
ncbi:hypothetical protein [Burkholderia pseudomallei]|uniref:hypothetical protein n=1 Tax=Burkholderia pseudomallei TaxID=28450 RepID=UPI0002F94913|nr:hypothetical protein [Burkholderia pseudomallei]MBM5619947.1 hypothetical protein [Burkholderia pseudomallei]MBM5629571.1 hypothetical protein [Burkholderia pseudomallei]MBM5659709.1 hypothetical protein [Burkholderia pseudomallei]MBM5663648.1 hypothetical protein [Burkholderia pseudomallei]